MKGIQPCMIFQKYVDFVQNPPSAEDHIFQVICVSSVDAEEIGLKRCSIQIRSSFGICPFNFSG